ncbi:MAG: hypothetical protein CMK64_04935 [Pseudoalteromonas sp.]|nr:hypothetical protein [Pseudoalteromonas sp.]
MAKNCPRNGHLKYRNKLILDLLAIVGLRPREICLLAPSHFMCPKGTFSEFLLIGEEWSFNGNERPVVLSHDEVKKSLQDYLHWMIQGWKHEFAKQFS